MIKFVDEMAKIAAKGVIGGGWGKLSSTAQSGAFLSIWGVPGVSGGLWALGPGKIYLPIGAQNRRFGHFSHFFADFFEKVLDGLFF